MFHRLHRWCLLGFLLLLVSVVPSVSASAAERLTPLDLKAKSAAEQCTAEIVKQFNLLLSSGRLSVPQLFDTFYVPIPDTSPQKFHTQYDRLTDGILQPILDKYLARDSHFVFVVAVDCNGYLPTHDTKYSQPLTGNPDHDLLWNRTKRIFDDRTGLAAARNTKPFLLQHYSRDTGEMMHDMSVPIFIDGRHWGAVRIGYHE
jgi:hypothetical protein